MNEFPSTQQYYVESSLYSAIYFESHLKPDLYNLLFTDQSIDLYCLDCQSHSIFLPVDNLPKTKAPITVIPFYLWSKNVQHPFTVSKKFTCSRNHSHSATFFSLVNENSIIKVGQHPSLADIATNDILKYKKVLGPEYYNEYSKAIGLFAHGVGVGSFVYLRRIVENFIIKPAYESAKKRSDWDDALFNKSRFKERVDLLKSDLPDFLVENKNLYSIISKGIHELSEDECKQYFPVLRDCIEFILTELETKRQTDLKKQQLSKSLSSITQKLK